MTARIQHIRTYSCACGVRFHDHGEPGAKFLDKLTCPRCRKVMTHSTAPYSVSIPDAENHPMRRIAVRLSA